MAVWLLFKWLCGKLAQALSRPPAQQEHAWLQGASEGEERVVPQDRANNAGLAPAHFRFP